MRHVILVYEVQRVCRKYTKVHKGMQTITERYVALYVSNWYAITIYRVL